MKRTIKSAVSPFWSKFKAQFKEDFPALLKAELRNSSKYPNVTYTPFAWLIETEQMPEMSLEEILSLPNDEFMKYYNMTYYAQEGSSPESFHIADYGDVMDLSGAQSDFLFLGALSRELENFGINPTLSDPGDMASVQVPKEVVPVESSKKLNSSGLPSAEENLVDPVFIPETDAINDPVEGNTPDSDTNMRSTEISYSSDETEIGPGEQDTFTEVAGQTNDIEILSGADTPAKKPSNGAIPNVELPEETGGVEATGLMGDDGAIVEADITPESDVYDFNTAAIAAIEVPIQESDDSQVIEMIEVQPGVFALSSCAIRKNGRVRSAKFFSGEAAKTWLQSQKNLVKAPLSVNLQNRVVAMSSKNEGLIFQNSNVLGLIAVKAPLIRGIKNCAYRLFSSKNGHLVDSEKHELTSSTKQRVIASVTSNRGVKVSSVSRNLFSEVEKAYIRYLQSAAKNSSAKLIKALKQSKAETAMLRKELAKVTSRYRSEKASLQSQIDQSASDLSTLRQSVLTSQESAAVRANSEAERKAASIRSAAAKERTEKLARMMGSF